MATKTKDIIELLKDDSTYYGEVGQQFLSNSDIGALLKNPTEFRIPREDNKNFAEGRYFHQLILEPDKAMQTLCVDVASRNSKAYKEFVSENDVSVALLSKECDNIVSMVDKIKSNIDFYDAINEPGNCYEQPAVKEIKGHMWKGKADIINKDYLIDLKTTSDIQSFKRSILKYNYNSQAYIYQQLFGKPLVFFVIDKTTHQLGMFRLSDQSLRDGEEKVERAIEIYEKFFGDNPISDINNYYIEETI